ncbi:MAG: chromosome segregation SMC family protein [Pikeienuella sp.]
MRFTRLRLQGFKSFVDPTELEIGPGLSGVVGPNGCGKSNLFEALRWVMGESRARAMRGTEMENVIFAGSAARPARNAAEVALVIDNSEGRAPEPFAKVPEIEVSRRIARDTGSAFRVNGRPARARDVALLFADASTGAQSPGLVRQGEIGELISARPATRRRVIEEAAGVAGLFQRRQEAERRLAATQANLSRLSELVAGFDQRLGTLSRQAAQAKRYREIAEALRRAEALRAYLRWRQSEGDATDAEAALSAAVVETSRAERVARDAVARRAAAEAALAPLREEAMVAAAVRQRAGLAVERQADQLAQAQAAVAAARSRLSEAETDLAREIELAQEASSAEMATAAEIARLEDAVAAAPAAAEAASKAAQLAEAAVAEAEVAHDRLAAETLARAAERAAAARAADETAKAAAAARQCVAETAGALRRATEAAAAAQTEADTLQAAAAAALARREAADAAAISAGQARAKAAELSEAAELAGASAQAEARALSVELAALSAALAETVPVADAMIDQVSVPAGLEAALAAAIGDDLGLGVSPEIGGSGWADAACPDPCPALPAGAVALSALISGPERLRPRLSLTGLVDATAGARLQAALAPGQRLVSRAGDLWRWDGLRRAAGDAASEAAGRLARRNRLAALEAARGEVERRRDAAAAESRASAKALAQARARDAAARQQTEAAAAAARDALRRADKAAMARDRAVAVEADLSRRAAAAERDHEAAAAAARAARARLAEVPDDADDPAAGSGEAGLAQAKAWRDTARRAAFEARGRAEVLRREQAGREKRLATLRRDVHGWRRRAAAAHDRRAALQARIAEAEIAVRASVGHPDAAAQETERLSHALKTAEQRAQAADAALAAGEADLRAAEAAARRREAEAGACREAKSRREAARDAARAHAETEAAEILATYNVTPEALGETYDLATEAARPIAAVEADIAKLTRQRDGLGAVNLRAEADAAEIAAERDMVAAEKADLEAALDRLRTALRTLNREGRSRMRAAFEEVNQRFHQLFATLFGGGEARLVLVDSEDMLEAGIEILCQPPGKRLSTLSLLSGGEQTLTALSLIFAVFLANPAPVCVLDEVDAPLDDANILRFCALLDEMVKVTDTRFLIITHHPLTMSRMDRLFGVTMVERGVSRLVSVDLAGGAALAGPQAAPQDRQPDGPIDARGADAAH